MKSLKSSLRWYILSAVIVLGFIAGTVTGQAENQKREHGTLIISPASNSGTFTPSADTKHQIGLAASGRHLMTIAHPSGKVLWVDAKWCGEQWGHVWEQHCKIGDQWFRCGDGVPDGVSYGYRGSLDYGGGIKVIPVTPAYRDPCEGRNYEHYYVCRICKARKTSKSTCEQGRPKVEASEEIVPAERTRLKSQ